MTPYDNLIELSETAIADTHKWERRGYKFKRFDQSVLGFDILLLAYSLATKHWLNVILATGLIAIMIGLLFYNDHHIKWVLEVRERWENDHERYQLQRMEYVEGGYDF